MNISITDQLLEQGEFFDEVVTKTTVYAHHTAGSHNPVNTISGWDSDKSSNGGKLPVATAFLIGGLSTSIGGDASFDGKIYRAFDESKFAHHLGLKQANNLQLNKQSIGIEVCNYGPITLGKDGVFYNYVSKPVPKEMVVKLDKPFRGYTYYHAYTDKQIESLKNLILYIKEKFPTISLTTPLTTVDGFEINDNAKTGKSGLYSHSNVRTDKFDMSPQPKLIEMIKTLK